MITPAKIFETLGRLSVLLSTLEAEVQTLLCRLLSKEDFMMAASVLEWSTFSRTLASLEKVAPFQDAILEARITRLLAVVKPLRKKRNLFVHGCWDISQKFLDQGRVMVSESKIIKFEHSKNRKSWRRGIEHELTYQELLDFQAAAMRGLKMTKELLMTFDHDA